MINKVRSHFTILNHSESVFDLFGVEFIVKGQFEGGQTILIHMQVSEGMPPTLWGFESQEDRAMFRMLIGVNNVGCKTAYSIIDTYGAEATSSIIRSNDVKALTLVSGVGRKTAETITSMLEVFNKEGNRAPVQDAIKGLIKLGYGKTQLKKVEWRGETAEQLIQAAIKQLQA